MNGEAEFSTRLKWLIAIVCSVLITLVGLLLLYRDVADQTIEEPATQYVAQEAAIHEETETITAGEKLDLNRATAEELKTLPGVGEALAGRIVAFREKTPFKVVRDLKKIPGIGEKKFKALSGYVCVEEAKVE